MSKINPDDLLKMVAAEHDQAIGFDLDSGVLQADRERALNYYKGEMPDLPSLPGRSAAVSTDISDAIETVMPDLIEIFAGDDDVFAFIPTGEADQDAARQETEFLRYVIFNQNPGFVTLYSMFKDALLVKEGIVKFWFEGKSSEATESYNDQPAEVITELQKNGDVTITERRADMFGNEVYDCEVKVRTETGRVRIAAVPPEDFAVGAGTVTLADATYCVMRSRLRVQDLIAQGYDAEKVRALPATTLDGVDVPELHARDTVGESDPFGSYLGDNDMRFVEVREHYIKLWDGSDYCIHKILTDAAVSTLIDHDEVTRIPFASVTPFLTPHRYHGRSVADLLIETQRIKTALTRVGLDQAYFALSQRMEIAMDQINEYTIEDLMQNSPMHPVRTRTGTALRPLTAGALNYDVFAGLEYFSTVAEGRTGIVRNAQGLNPDTLHDTAKGAAALMSAAQKRIRLMARIFAETGLKDLYLGVHGLIRENPMQAQKVRLRGGWVNIDPSRFGNRADMTIEVGEGASGRAKDIAAIQGVLQLQMQAIQMQGGVQGPLVNLENAYNSLIKYTERAGLKSPEMYFMKPPQPGEGDQAAAPAAPDPATLKAQADREKAQAEMMLKKQVADQEHALAVEKLNRETALKQEQLNAEMALRQQQLQAEAQMRMMGFGGNGGQRPVRFGGDVG